MPINTQDLPTERLKRVSARNSEQFGPSLSAFRGQLNPAVANAFGLRGVQPQVPQLPAAAGVEAPPTVIEPVGAPLQGKPLPPPEFEGSASVEEAQPFFDREVLPPEEPSEAPPSFESRAIQGPLTGAPVHDEDMRSDDELRDDLWFIPEKALAARWNDGTAYDTEFLDRMMRIRAAKDERGMSLGSVYQVAKQGLAMSPGVAIDFLRSVFVDVPSTVWDGLAAKTVEEQATAVQTLLAGTDIGFGESSDLLMNVPGMRAFQESIGGLAEGRGLIESGRAATAENLRDFVAGPLSFILPKSGEKWVESQIRKLDSDTAADDFLQRAGRYFQRVKETEGKGFLASNLGLSEEEMNTLGIVIDPELADSISFVADAANLAPVSVGAKGFKLLEKTTGKTLATAATRAGITRAKSAILDAAQKAAKGTVEGVKKGARKAVEKTLTIPGTALKEAGEYAAKKMGGIAMATGLTAGLLQGRPEYLLIGVGAVLGSKVMSKVGAKMAAAGVKFGKKEGMLEFVRRRAATGGRGAVHGFVGAAPLALLADDPEMAAGILASGSIGAFGALGAEAKSGARSALLTDLNKAWNSADVQAINSPAYEATGENAADITAMNTEHENAMRKLGTQPNGSKSVALINRLRETFRTIVNPRTKQAVPGRIWLLSRKAFRDRFGADAHGAFTGESPSGSYEIYLSEDATGAGHEVGHLMHALLTPEQSINLQRTLEKEFGADKIESFRETYERTLNLNLEEGQPAVEISREEALNEMAAEHYSLMSRGLRLDGLGPDSTAQVREHVGRIMQRIFPSFRPEVAEAAQVVPGNLPLEASFATVQAAREAARLSGLPDAPVEVVPTEPAPPAPSAPPAAPEAPGGSAPAPLIPTPVAPTAPGAPTPAAPITPRLPGVTPRGALPPVTAGEETPENLRGPQTGKFAEGGARDVKDLNDVNRILREVEADPDFDATQKEVLRTVAQAINEVGTAEGGPLVSLFYNSVRPGGKESARRWARRAEQAMAYVQEQLSTDPNIKETTRQVFQKNTIPYRFSRTKNGKVQILGMSPDKVLGNATLLLNDLAGSQNNSRRALLDWFPPEWEYTKRPDGTFTFTSKGLDALAADLVVYSNNHKNGFTGSGQPVQVPAGYQRFIPQPNPGFTPTPLPRSTATVMNALMGIAPPTTTTQRGAGAGRNPVTGEKVTIPANVEAQILATENGLTAVPSSAAKFTKKEAKERGLAGVEPEVAGAQPTFTVPELGGAQFPIAELNPFRQQMQATGYNPKDSLTEAVERINLEDVVMDPKSPTGGVKVRPTPIAEVSTPLATAGFLPRNQALKRMTDVRGMGVEEFSKWAATAEGGITGQAYEAGISLAQDTDIAVPMAQEFHQEASNAARVSMKAGEYDVANVNAIKGQFFRETREVLQDSDSMEGFSSTIGLMNEGLLMRHHAVGSVIKKMRTGEEFGGTFNADGTKFDPSRLTELDPDDSTRLRPEPLDVVTLASVNIPLSELTHVRLKSELAPYVDSLGFNRVKPGLFKLDAPGPRGEAMVSIDVNAIVNQKHRANSVAFATANNQQSIYDLAKNVEVPTGGTGDTVIKDPTRLRNDAETLVKGTMPEIPKTKKAIETDLRQRTRTLKEVSALLSQNAKPGESVDQVQALLDATERQSKAAGFLPKDVAGLETIKAAAVKSRITGQVWTGPMHFAALHDAIRALKLGPLELMQHFPDTYVDQGFVTSEGRYVDRREAFKIGERAQQIREGAENSGEVLQSEDTVGLGPKAVNTPRGEFQALPRTKGDATIERRIGEFDVVYRSKEGAELGKLQVGLPREGVAVILAVDVNEEHTRQGIATHLYQLAQEELIARGVTTVRGSLEGSGTVGLREKAFGPGRTRYTQGGVTLTPEEAAKIMDEDFGYVHAETTLPRGEKVDPNQLNLFLPRNRVDVTKDPASWILPNGDLRAVKAGRHENDLAANAAEYNKRFGTKFSTTPQEFEGRRDALRAGFTRVRFTDAGNTLTVEVPASRWPKVRKQVEKLFTDNEDAVDTLKLSIVDTKPNTPKTLDYTQASGLSRSQNPFAAVEEAMDNLRGTRQSAMFLPKDASIVARRRAARQEVDAHAAKFPEALPLQVSRDEKNIPKVDAKGQLQYDTIPYNLPESFAGKQLAKGLGRNLTPRQRFLKLNDKISDRIGEDLVKYYEGIDDPRVKEQAANWYKLASRLGSRIFGPDLEFFAQLLAATSPNTDVRANYLLALEAYNRYRAGEFSELVTRGTEALTKFEQGDPTVIEPFMKAVKTAGKMNKDQARRSFARWWSEKEGLTPLRRSGKKFGINSKHVATVLLNEWSAEDAGGKKTSQFTKNLTGTDMGPTIDVWAMRAPHRLLNEQSGKPWRIPFKNEGAVKDVEYDTVANGYRRAAEKLGLDPADLQAVVWFAEKKYWDEKGWTKGVGAKLASFVEFMEATKVTPEGERVVQPTPGKELAGLDLTLEEAEQFNPEGFVPGALTEEFGTAVVEPLLEQKLRRKGLLPGQTELAL